MSVLATSGLPDDDERLTPAEARAAALARGYSVAAANRAAALAAGPPPRDVWGRFLPLVAGAVGAGLLASALVTFFAANWARMGRFSRLGALELFLIATTVVAARWFRRLSGRLALDLGFVGVGALLAVFGQTYQTGADPYQLFLGWAALGAPWVLVARADELWLLESVVLGTGLTRYWSQRVSGHDDGVMLIAWVVGTLAVVAWELQARRAQPWLRARWLPRVWATLAGLAVSFAWIVRLFDRHEGQLVVVGGALALSLGAVALARRRGGVDLYLQTAALGVLIVCITAAAAYPLSRGGEPFFVFFVLTLLVVGQSALAVRWLRAELRRAAKRTG
jgi:uncharacterized membrane protein